MKKERQSNIELLRIISIIFIIMFHYVYKSGYTYNSLDINTYVIKIFFFLGELGCNLFLLITGYFYCKNKVTANKTIKFLLQIYFYYIITVLIGYHLGLFNDFPLRQKLIMCFPVSLARYWFITAYFLIYLLSPYLNTLIDNLKQNNYKKLLVMFFILWSFIPTIVGLLFNSSEVSFFYNRFIWAVILYFAGAYIKKYGFKFIDSFKKNIILVMISIIIIILSIKLFYNHAGILSRIGTIEIAYLWTPNNIFMLLLSIGLFNLFLRFKFNSTFINTISSTTLGIYLMSDGVLDRYIWDVIFKTKEHLYSDLFLFHIIGSSLIIFIFCVVVDLLRQLLEKVTINKLLNSKQYNSIKNKISNSFDKLLNKI